MVALRLAAPQMGALSASSDHFSRGSTQDAVKAGNKTTVMMKPVVARSRRNLSDAFSQSAPDLNIDPSQLFDDDDDDNNSFGHNSVSDWSAALSPTKSSVKPVRASTGLPFSQNPNPIRQVRPSSSFSGRMPNTNTSIAANGTGTSKKTKLKASDLGIKIGKNTTPEELEQAVMRWKTEQGKSTSSLEVSSSSLLSNGSRGKKEKKEKKDKKEKKEKREKKLETEQESADFTVVGGESRKNLMEKATARSDHSAYSACSASSTGDDISDSQRSKKIVIRRRRPGSGTDSSLNGQQDQVVKKYITRSELEALTNSESGSPKLEGLTPKLRVAQIKADAENAVRRGRSKSPYARGEDGQRSRSKSRSKSKSKPRSKSSKRSQSPAEGIKGVTRNRTPSRRAAAHTAVQPVSVKGRDLSRSPKGSDFRPVSWRLEDSSMHIQKPDNVAEENRSSSRGKSRRGPRTPVLLDETDEVQKRLRQAGISIDQYRAMLAVGLSVELVN